jgi:hypothetical protein
VGSAATTAAGDQDGDSRFGLSVIQIVASTASAVTAAVIGSRLGVAGTLTGPRSPQWCPLWAPRSTVIRCW